jgi:hypothetical protein
MAAADRKQRAGCEGWRVRRLWWNLRGTPLWLHHTRTKAAGGAHRAHEASREADVQEQATCDMAAEGISDMRGGLLGFPFNSPDAARQQSAGLLNRYAPVFVQLLQTGGPYVAGGASMTYADVLLAGECVRCAHRAVCREWPLDALLLDHFTHMASLRPAEAMTGYTEMLPELAGVFPDLDTHRTLICEVRHCNGCSRLPSTGNTTWIMVITRLSNTGTRCRRRASRRIWAQRSATRGLRGTWRTATCATYKPFCGAESARRRTVQ